MGNEEMGKGRGRCRVKAASVGGVKGTTRLCHDDM